MAKIENKVSELAGGGVLVSGSLAGVARTITGVQSQAEWFGIGEKRLEAILRQIGLPHHTLSDPTFLISFDQELALIEAMMAEAKINRSVLAFVFSQHDLQDLLLFGTPGLAMRHAPTLLAMIRVGIDFPQLLWGHSRIQVVADADNIAVTFSIELQRYRAHAAFVEYLLLLDLVSYYHFVRQIMGPDAQVQAIHLPFDPPHDAAEVTASVSCPIKFRADRARLVLPAGCEKAEPLRARSFVYRQSINMCKELAKLRPAEGSLADQARRWLWAYSPPLSRPQLAKQLNMSERSLARGLKNEGTSYQQLYADVQLERAGNLLRVSGQSIAEIGYELGYSEPAAFTRAFVSWTGQTPTQWRGPGRQP